MSGLKLHLPDVWTDKMMVEWTGRVNAITKLFCDRKLSDEIDVLLTMKIFQTQ